MKAGPWACESACRQFMRPGAPLFSATGSYSEEVFLLYDLIKEPDRGDLLTLEGMWVIREGEWWEVISNMASMILASWSSCHYLISSHRKWTELPYLLLSNRIRHEWCVLQLRLDLKQTNKQTVAAVLGILFCFILNCLSWYKPVSISPSSLWRCRCEGLRPNNYIMILEMDLITNPQLNL